MSPLEERIGYKFRNSRLLTEAITHPSLRHETPVTMRQRSQSLYSEAATHPSLRHETQRHDFDNQRLEFLGDAILQLVITEYLYEKFRGEPEGQLTKLRSRLVSRDTLKIRALALDLGRFLMMGHGEEASGGRARTSTLADAFEALIGAIYLDSDLKTVRKFILTQARPDLEQVAKEPVDINPKGNLQELLQGISPASPVYKTLSQSGPEHAKTFVVEVIWEGIALGQGKGPSKKHAETAAAEEAMQLRRWEKRKKPTRAKRKIDK